MLYFFLCFSHCWVERMVLLAYIVARTQTTKHKDLRTIPARDAKERLRGQSMIVLNWYIVDVEHLRGSIPTDNVCPGWNTNGEIYTRVCGGWIVIPACERLSREYASCGIKWSTGEIADIDQPRLDKTEYSHFNLQIP